MHPASPKPHRWLNIVLPGALAAAYLAARSQFWSIIPIYVTTPSMATFRKASCS